MCCTKKLLMLQHSSYMQPISTYHMVKTLTGTFKWIAKNVI